MTADFVTYRKFIEKEPATALMELLQEHGIVCELEEDKKMFDSLLEIVSDNIQNDHFYNTYKRLRQTLITETKACQEALMSRRQQRTWNPPRNSKLAFHLN
jgi:hypothetical protein